MNMRMFDFDLEDCDSCGLIIRFESGITYSRYSLEDDGWQAHTIASETGLLVPIFYLTGDRDSEVRFINRLNQILSSRSVTTSDDGLIAINRLFSEFKETSMISIDEKEIEFSKDIEKGWLYVMVNTQDCRHFEAHGEESMRGVLFWPA